MSYPVYNFCAASRSCKLLYSLGKVDSEITRSGLELIHRSAFLLPSMIYQALLHKLPCSSNHFSASRWPISFMDILHSTLWEVIRPQRNVNYFQSSQRTAICWITCWFVFNLIWTNLFNTLSTNTITLENCRDFVGVLHAFFQIINRSTRSSSVDGIVSWLKLGNEWIGAKKCWKVGIEWWSE